MLEGPKTVPPKTKIVRMCLSVCLAAAGKSTFVGLLQGESEEWEVIPEPIGKWCNIQKEGDDVYQVKTSGLSCKSPFVFRVNVCLMKLHLFLFTRRS